MIDDDIFVIEGIAHTVEMRESRRFPPGEALLQIGKTLHESFPPETTPPCNWFEELMLPENVNNSYFRESQVDLAVTHHLPLYSYFEGGLVTIESQRQLVEEAPQRWVVYAGVDPTAGLDQAIESLEEQVELIPQTIGLKLYPAQLDPLRAVYLDDEDNFPLWQRAQELGLKVISVHKASPYGPVPINPFRVDDVEGAAGAFPDMSFEIMHGGLAFVEETAMMIGRFPNVYTNLEGTAWIEYLAPKRFEEALAAFVFHGGASKIIWGTGGPVVHPQFLLERFMDFEFSSEVLEEWGIPQITREQKIEMLGGTFAKMVDLDLEAMKRGIADDEFAQAQAAHGRSEPFSHWIQSPAEPAAAG